MSYDKQKVINIALAEVGYLEKETISQLDHQTANAGDENITKYARDMAEINFYNGRKQGVAWCDVFVDWCFMKAYGKAAALALTCQPTKAANNAGAGCKWSRKYYQEKGRLFDNPQPGDQIFFGNASSVSHTGLVYRVANSKVYTIEGNTSASAGVVPNGGGVYKKSYPLTHGRIYGYGRPDYGAQVEETLDKATEKPAAVDYSGFETYTVKKGDTLWRIAQKTTGSGSKYKAIMTLNQLSSEKLKIGQVLKIREKTGSGKTEAKTPDYTEYTVKKGDSLWRIAAKHLGRGSRYREIMTASSLSSDKLKIGQKLKIPKV
ncbi:MAG: LysM peptidoglycan-binding domain-containing protein [Kiritimatiellae bacterium]|nr:LysM peptidoglycan-binding domain-containing protein [Kiritimatiellia bacterium]